MVPDRQKGPESHRLLLAELRRTGVSTAQERLGYRACTHQFPLILAGEERAARQHLGCQTGARPYVYRDAVLGGPRQHFRSAIPSAPNVLRPPAGEGEMWIRWPEAALWQGCACLGGHSTKIYLNSVLALSMHSPTGYSQRVSDAYSGKRYLKDSCGYVQVDATPCTRRKCSVRLSHTEIKTNRNHARNAGILAAFTF